ncbi:MAG: UDP-N-acetylmuramoyl-L-alanine--D-glutamate ligase [Zoogloeaceae bacterium]|jgi:UDP-N-acetylmuramoylalanine--D-glutamate ligase|nr:UDP-N-acetylmuramoyl-L-alanine--D-glutamate ligase [Zoogloeaceae bacterium]
MELREKRFVVAGLGESGLAMAKWLYGEGAAVRVVDSRQTPPNGAELAACAPGIEILAGAFTEETFADAEMIALSPGVPLATPAIAAAQARGVPVVSEADLFSLALAGYAPHSRMLAITGSNGKTTTTALTAHLLNGAGVPAVACGNISPSLLDAFMAARAANAFPAVWVLELSSFQLETTHILPALAATVLNISADHLDRYAGSLDAYVAAKARIFQGGARHILNRDDDYSLALGGCGADMVTFGLDPAPRAGHYGCAKKQICLGATPLVALADLPLAGLHNAANVMAALALCRVAGVEAERVLPALAGFKGLPHRVETVAEAGGVVYVDDSKGTNVGATLAAIEGMGRKVAVVLGGDGKGQDFAPLAPALKKHGRAVALIGRDARQIASVLAAVKLPLKFCADMEEAVTWLGQQAQSGDCVLLSPACASWDMYRDYVERAERFRAAVARLTGGENAS